MGGFSRESGGALVSAHCSDILREEPFVTGPGRVV